MEEEKRRLEEKIRGESERAKNYEAMLRRIGEEREDERRKTQMSEQQALRSIEKLNKEREEIRKLLESNEAEKEENEEYIRQMQYQMEQKEQKLSALIDELTRKSTLNEDELLMLKDEVEQ